MIAQAPVGVAPTAEVGVSEGFLDAADLVRSALEAMGRAHAPYSRFPVGAVIRTDAGVFIGVNVENSSFGLTTCAERVAIGSAVAAGATSVDLVVVATTASPPVMPCGACRQVIAEFGRDAEVLAVNEQGDESRASMRDLLPMGFSYDLQREVEE